MKFKNKLSFIIIPFLILLLTGCAQKSANKQFKHDTPLIKTDVKQMGKQELEKSAEMGPTPVDGDVVKLKKRKQLSSCLLYTSPSPRDATLSRMPSSA